MKRMNQLIPGQQSIRMTSIFRGYNHNKVISDGEMYDMQNMSGDGYPVLSLRQKRAILSLDVEGQDPVPLTGIHGRDQLVFIRGTDVYYNFTPVTGINVSAESTMLPKKIVSFGAYVCIWPDKKYFNTVHLDDCGSMERLWSTTGENKTGADVSVSMCRVDGTAYSAQDIPTTEPPDPDNGDYWIDQSGDNDVLRQYSSATMEWIEVATTYVKISCSNIGNGIREYDSVVISGLEAPSTETDPKVQAQVEALNGTMIVFQAATNYIVVAGLVSKTLSTLKNNEVKANLEVPDLDFICESNNRLWGCSYGWKNGQVINELRACKLGDFRNWNNYMGLSTDSYTASVGTDGPWTGCAVQRGYPVFFKENAIHKVSGYMPSSFSVTTIVCRGVQDGSWRSVQVVNEYIIYKSTRDVMIFDGSMPTGISEALGDILYYDARAGALGSKYYISMKDKSNTYRMFVYDTKNGTWYKEDITKALGFGNADDDLYFIDETHNTINAVRGTCSDTEGLSWSIEQDFDWAAEFDLFGTTYIAGGNSDSPIRVRNSKYLSMFKIRMYLDPDAYVRLWIKYNDSPIYEFMGERRGSDMRSFSLPVVPKRCDHVRFKLTGHGDAVIYDISRLLEVGGDGI